MSTKAIRVALEAVRSAMADDMDGLYAPALAEVEAIEKACAVLTDIWGYAGDENPAELLVRAIAAQRNAGTS